MNDNEMNKDNLNQDPEIKENDVSADHKNTKNLSLPIFIAAIAAIVGITVLLVPGHMKKPQQTTDAVTEDSVSDEQTATTESVTATPVPTDIPDISGQDEDKKIARNANEYLVYPESYERSQDYQRISRGQAFKTVRAYSEYPRSGSTGSRYCIGCRFSTSSGRWQGVCMAS